MLKNIAWELLRRLFFWTQIRNFRLRRRLQAARKASALGDKRDALRLYEQCRNFAPENVDVLIGLADCLGHIGEARRAQELYELVYRLDDSNLSAGINRASHLIERGKIGEALPLLVRAQVVVPNIGPVLTVYTGIQMRKGRPESAKAYALRAWMADFENIRYANSYLFTAAYTDMTEEDLAAEHQFWGQTCSAPRVDPVAGEAPEPVDEEPAPGLPLPGKLRIGYWSPDLREHSVRYFFRPLLEGHDRSRVELIVYNDAQHKDAQTASIQAHCDHFLNVFDKTDAQLYRFVKSHQLDVLVELAGHTSFNRLPLLQKRMARMQVTGIGYPCTTGLSAIDAKILDRHIMTGDAARYYAEQPLVLPESFWCFDPMVDVPLAEDPPCVQLGKITFGCFGNASKINEKIVRCWIDILGQVPGSRLLLQSVTFDEPAILTSMSDLLASWNLPRDRFELRGSTPGSQFYRSYDDVDVILDTHPFNGGTTTCFAVYMGVPVITLRGQSILSRMGYTVLSNVGAPELAVDTLEEYIGKAVALAGDVAYLRRFRQEARSRMKQTSLGDGRRFAADFEAACQAHLAAQKAGSAPYEPAIATLPAAELVRRAGQIFASGNGDAGARVTQYCLQHYPDFGPAHILATDAFTREGDFAGAAEYLLDKAGLCSGADKVALYVNIVRCWVLAGALDRAADAVRILESIPNVEALDALQVRLCQVSLAPGAPAPRTILRSGIATVRVRCVIACDEPAHYRNIVQHVTKICLPVAGCDVRFMRCGELARIRDYEDALHDDGVDVVVFLRRNVLVLSPHFFGEILRALEGADMVGYGGGMRWNRLDWQSDEFGQRAWGLLSPSGEKPGFWDLSLSGNGHDTQIPGAAMLAGDCIAVRARRSDYPAFDGDLLDGGELLEQMWSHQAYRAGWRLAIHRNLGLHIGPQYAHNEKYTAAVRAQFVEKMKFDAFPIQRDGLALSMPCRSVEEALTVMTGYLVDADLSQTHH